MKGINIYFGMIYNTTMRRPAIQSEATDFMVELGWHDAELSDAYNGGYLIDLTDEAAAELERDGEITKRSLDHDLTVTIYLD